MRSLMLRIAVPTLALGAFTAPVDAGLVTHMDTANAPIMTFTIPSQGMYGESGYVGPNSVKLGNGPFIQAYCTNLFRSIGIDDSYPASIQPLSALPGGDLVARLFTADAASKDSSTMEKAALQLAIWDVVESARMGLAPSNPGRVGPLTSMEYKVAGAIDVKWYSADMNNVIDRVSSLLNTASPTSYARAKLTYIGTDTSYGQGFAELTPVPEPSTFISAGLGLIGLLVVKLRRRPAGV